MARSEGSLCSKEAKSFADEITTLSGMSYKQNLDYFRLIEKLIVYRITEQVREGSTKNSAEKPDVSVEIPLLGTLTIRPIVFHKSHRLTDKPSMHFEYTFEPLSGFKKHILDAFLSLDCDLASEFISAYGQKLTDLYGEVT